MVPTNENTQVCHVLTMIDGSTDELVGVLELRGFILSEFAAQFDVPTETDPDMLDRYAVGPDDAQFLNNVVGYEVTFDFSKYAYFVEAAEKD